MRNGLWLLIIIVLLLTSGCTKHEKTAQVPIITQAGILHSVDEDSIIIEEMDENHIIEYMIDEEIIERLNKKQNSQLILEFRSTGNTIIEILDIIEIN